MNGASSGTESLPSKPDDTFLATCILIGAVVIVLIAGIYLWRNKKIFGGSDGSWKHIAFTPPPEREAFIEAKKTFDSSKLADIEKMRKLLMRRALHTIPLLLQLQNEGHSIERLYKKGMLTDDMHFQLKEMKAFVDQEFQDVQFEADELVEGWGQQIWREAMRYHQLVEKQSEIKQDEIKQAESEKKKAAADKKKAKKTSSKPLSNGALPDAKSNEPVTESEIELENRKALEAERMAQQLLEEEELEKKKKSENKNKSVSKGKKQAH
eukprot:gene11888-15906_t